MSDRERSDRRPVRIPFTVTLDQYDAVKSYLDEHHVYHQFDGDELVVPAGHVTAVHDLLDRHAPRNSFYEGSGLAWVDGRIPPLRRERRSIAADDTNVVRIARVWTRPVRYLVDGIAGGVVVAIVASTVAGGDGDPSRTTLVLVSLVVWLVLFMAPTALWGRTVGAWATRTRLVRYETLDAPGWASTIVRSVVPQVPALAGSCLFLLDLGRRTNAWIAAIAVVAGWAVYLSLLTNGDRRGWHDRLSRTVVIEHRPHTTA